MAFILGHIANMNSTAMKDIWKPTSNILSGLAAIINSADNASVFIG